MYEHNLFITEEAATPADARWIQMKFYKKRSFQRSIMARM